MELITELGVCEYNVTSADMNPAQNYHLLPGLKDVFIAVSIYSLLTEFFIITRRLPSGQWNRNHRIASYCVYVSRNL